MAALSVELGALALEVSDLRAFDMSAYKLVRQLEEAHAALHGKHGSDLATAATAYRAIAEGFEAKAQAENCDCAASQLDGYNEDTF